MCKKCNGTKEIIDEAGYADACPVCSKVAEHEYKLLKEGYDGSNVVNIDAHNSYSGRPV